jgi:peptidoglycan glycosyltransferase
VNAQQPSPVSRRGPAGGGDRRRRLTQRALPVVALAGASLIAGLIVGARHVPEQRHVAERFATAWQHGDYVRMYADLSDDAKKGLSVADFADHYRAAADTATELPHGLRVGKAKDAKGGAVRIPVTVRTRIFGITRGSVVVPFVDQGGAKKVDWKPNLVYPGLAPGETLTRHTQLPERAAILARDGKALAKGDDRASDLGGVATQVVGSLGPIPPEGAETLRAEGIPSDANVGTSGLERAFQSQLAGRPGGRLLAGGRVIGSALMRPGHSVRTSIDPEIEASAISALGARFGSVAVLDPRDGQVLALVGVAFSGLAPPGSTFKVITTTGALDAHIVKLSDQFPIASHATLEGVALNNANGEFCGGTFEHAFAVSCNSVFAPLGAKLGANKLVAEAEKFGFNEKPQIDGAATSTLPPGPQVGDDLAVGSTAIGQGKVQASALQMASVAATIGARGERYRPTLVFKPRQKPVRVTSPATAALVRRLMVEVVKDGTGTAAAIPGVTVAGKTGTAELGNGANGQQVNGDTDAWFIAFAPNKKARVAVAVFVARAGAGGQIAAPIARQVLITALSRN